LPCADLVGGADGRVGDPNDVGARARSAEHVSSVRRGARDAACAVASFGPPARAALPDLEEHSMSDRTYRLTEIVGTSPDGIDQAIRNGVERASRTVRHLDWFEVLGVRGQVKDGGVEHFQVTMKLGFRLEDD
jgi:flavin-binding protein dodecin